MFDCSLLTQDSEGKAFAWNSKCPSAFRFCALIPNFFWAWNKFKKWKKLYRNGRPWKQLEFHRLGMKGTFQSDGKRMGR